MEYIAGVPENVCGARLASLSLSSIPYTLGSEGIGSDCDGFSQVGGVEEMTCRLRRAIQKPR